MRMPETTDVPYFAYGLFKPKEPAHYKIEKYLDKSSEFHHRGRLVVNDGLPMLDFDLNGSLQGFLLYFKDPRAAKEAYKIISDYYPPDTHTWQKNSSSDIELNSVVRVKPKTRHDYFSNYEPIYLWSAKDDPIFNKAMMVIVNGMKKYRDMKFDIDEQDRFDWQVYYELQMKYLLLWSILERFMSFTISLNVGYGMNIRQRFASEYPPFCKACSKFINEKLDISKYNDPEQSKSLNPNEPYKCIEFFHCLRTNIIHRGKSAEFDGERLRKLVIILYSIVRVMLKEEGLFQG